MILSVAGKAQVRSAIVKPITIDVVDLPLVAALEAEDVAVKPDVVSVVPRASGAASVSLGMQPPAKTDEAIEVIVIDNCVRGN